MELGYGASPATFRRRCCFAGGNRALALSEMPHALNARMMASSSSPPPPPSRLGKDAIVLPGLKGLVDPVRYKVWLLDQFGVLHDGQKAYPGAIETCMLIIVMIWILVSISLIDRYMTVDRIAQTGVKLVVISNSSRRTTSTYERMQRLGFDPTLFTGIITSGELTHEYLLQRHDPWFAALGHKCIHITWSERSSISLTGLGLEIVESPESADFVLVHGTEALGLKDGSIRLTTVTEIDTVLILAAERGLPMVVANPDHVTVEARDLMIMPGSLGLKYEKLGGHVKYMGKPDSVIYKAAAELTGFEASDMIAVGDSLFHDIQGAMNNSIDSVFVAGGIHASDLGIGRIGDQPNPDELQLLLKSEGFYPTYVVPMFSW